MTFETGKNRPVFSNETGNPGLFLLQHGTVSFVVHHLKVASFDWIWLCSAVFRHLQESSDLSHSMSQMGGFSTGS